MRAGKNHARRMKPRRNFQALLVGLGLAGVCAALAPVSLVCAAEFPKMERGIAVAGFPALGTTNNPAPTKPAALRENKTAPEPGQKRKARFLATFGMVIIALMALVTAVALLRSLRQH